MSPDPWCPACGGRRLFQIGSLFDDRYGYPGIFPLLRCVDCGHQVLQGKFSPESLRDLYSNYYPRSTFNLEQYKPYQETSGFKAWLNGDKSSTFRWVPRNVRVLDIGCGFGESLGYHRVRGCDMYGVETDENIRRVADRYGFNVHVGLFDPSNYEPNSFDYVTLDQVIEHVTDPIQTLRGIATVMKPQGTAILSTPNAVGWGARVFGRKWINWHAPYHLQFFTTHSMQLVAHRAGLVLDRTTTITPSGWLHYQWLHLLTYPSEGAPSIFWAPGGRWSFMERMGRRALAIAHRCKINHVITRVFDVLGLGDNRLFFLRKP